jgi:hypothetical protein
MRKTIAIRKPLWHRMEAFFEGEPARVVTEVNKAEVLLQGVLYEASFPCPSCGHKIRMDKVKLRKEDTDWKVWTHEIADMLAEVDWSEPGARGTAAKRIMDMVQQMFWSQVDLTPHLGMCLIPQEACSNAQGEALRRMLEANLRMPVLLMSNNVQMVRLRPVSKAEADRILGETDATEEGAEGRLVAFPGGGGQEKPEGGEGTGAAGSDGPAADPGQAGAGEPDRQDPGEAAGQADQGREVGGDQGAEEAPEPIDCSER